MSKRSLRLGEPTRLELVTYTEHDTTTRALPTIRPGKPTPIPDGKRKSQDIIDFNLVHSFCSSCHFIIESDRAPCREFVWKNGEAVRGNFRGTKDESREARELVKRLSQLLGRGGASVVDPVSGQL